MTLSRSLSNLLIALSLLVSVPCYSTDPRAFPAQGIMQFLGLDDTSNPTSVKDGRAVDIQNINLGITGEAEKRNGYSFEVMLDTITAGDNYEPVRGLYELYDSDHIRTKLAIGSRLYSWTTGGVKT
ncbi:MAG: hypothetical protein V1709_11770, partial [Planctomycetota bacterium]